MKKWFLLLAVLLILPVVAMAEVSIAGNDVTAGGFWTTSYSAALTPVGSGDPWHIRYDPAANLLTLRDAHVCAPDEVYGLWCDGDLKIVVESGTSSSITGGEVPQPEAGETWMGSYGIHCDGSLSISGQGKLKVTGLDGGNSCGLKSDNLTIENADVTVVSSTAAAYSYALNARDVQLNNAALTVRGGDSGTYAYGMRVSSMTAENSKIDVKAGRSSAWHSLGIYADTDAVTVTNCELTVVADNESVLSNAMAGNYVQIGGTAEMTGATSVFSNNNAKVTLSDELTATGSAAVDGALAEAVIAEKGVFVMAGEPAAQVPVKRLVIKKADQSTAPDEGSEGGNNQNPGTDEPTDTPVAPLPPATGDKATPVLWMVLMVLCVPTALKLRKS